MEKSELGKGGFGSTMKSDFSASIVVFLVALPLCLGIALASGATPIAGLIAGIVGGVVVGLMSGSSLGVSGPAAGLAVIIGEYIIHFDKEGNGGYEAFLLVVVIAGIIQVFLGFIKAGVIADYFPSNVIKGMLAAIGLGLFLKQIPHALGFDADSEGDMKFIQEDGRNTFTEIWHALKDPHWGAILIAMISVGILLLWKTDFFKKNKMLSLIPGPLVVVAMGILLNEFFLVMDFSKLALTGETIVNIPVYGGVKNFVSSFKVPNFELFYNSVIMGDFDFLKSLMTMAVTVAVVASLESLLSVEATDKLDPLKRVTPADKELVAQGVGNIVSGMIGGLPVTQVIVRSSANLNAGGKTKMSAILHGVFIFVAVLAIPLVLNKIPKACLAGILFVIAYKLASVKLFKDMYSLKLRQFIPFIVTVVAILITDLLVGITIGLITSLYFILQNNRQNEPFEVKMKRKENGVGYVVRFIFSKEVNYLSKHILMQSLQDIPKYSEIHIDATHTQFLSHDVIESINDFKDSVAPRKNIKVEFKIKKDDFSKIDDDVLNQLSL